MFKFENNPKLGFYTVGDKIFYSKPEALISATKTNQFPTWNFNNETFNKLDWLHEPETNIQELYRQRAQQLRDRYDYIRIEVSGGADSSTALYSFLLNDIHIDEVTFRYPKRGENSVSNDPFNTKSENTLSEFAFAARPMLEWIKTHYPQVKITVHDYSDNMLDDAQDDSWIFNSKDYLQPGHAFKHDPLGLIDHKRLADSGKSICVLYGIDKPKLCIKDSKWYAYFIDFQANHANTVTREYSNITTEYFFWTPDLPEIVLKQAHLIKSWFDMPQNKILQHLVRWPNHSVTQRTTLEHVIKPLIYLDYDPATFQVAKPSNNFYPEMDTWFYRNFKDTPAYDRWQAGIQLVTDTIDDKYFNKELEKPVGFIGFLSPFYCLGDAFYKSTGINDFSKF